MADRKDLIEERIDEIRQDLVDCDLSAEQKNRLMDLVNLVDLVDKEVNDAHYRINIRKNEYNDLIESMSELNKELSNLSGMLKEYASTSNKLIEEYSNKVTQIIHSDRKQNLFISISLMILSLSCATMFSGIPVLGKLWVLIQKLPI